MASTAVSEPSTPSELNCMTDDALRLHVNRVIRSLNDNPVTPNTSDVPRIAEFVTVDVLLRLHNLVIDARNQLDRCGGWSKQETLAQVVACFTGLSLRRSDAEYVGNAQDSFLHHHLKELKRARNADSQQMSRARKRGIDVQPTRAKELMERVFQCRFGSVPRLLDTSRFQLPVNIQPVPTRRVLTEVIEVNTLLQRDIERLKRDKEASELEAWENLNVLCVAIEHERKSRSQAEERAMAATVAQESAAAQDAERVQALKAKLRGAADECKRTSGQLARLGAQVSSAHVEMHRAQEREAKARKKAEEAVALAASARAEEAERAAIEVSKLKVIVRTAETERARAEGKLVRLGNQVAVAHVEVSRAQEREKKVRMQAEKAAHDAAQAQVEAVAKVTGRLQAIQAERRDFDSERRQSAGQLQRLGSQLGTALVEAARAAETAKSAQTSVEVLRQRLRSQEESAALELAHLRQLKCQMAKRARMADKRAQESDLLRAELEKVREKLKMVRKELNLTQVQLNLSTTQDDEELEVSEYEQDAPESDSDCEAHEASTALKRMRSMPTWRPMRGKGQGRGEAKLEWGTRLIIYSLLAMMVPPAAVGMAIVAIVKRTAPWLNPAAPTYETVKRCRFELRFLEEVHNPVQMSQTHLLTVSSSISLTGTCCTSNSICI